MPTLTDADKVLRNDVGKRMATALEAIAQGGGGSAKIEEMTQAEYDQLTPAQKADGTLRAISDGETKIQDIDNVNITTSDNGKLLGVSVSGSDISVSAVETTAADIPYSQGVSVADKLDTIPPLVKSVFLTSSMNCNYADSSTIGYRSTTGDKVDITGISGYPTGKTILGVAVEYAYCGSVGEYYKVAQLNIVNNETWATSKVGGTVRFGVRVYYLDV